MTLTDGDDSVILPAHLQWPDELWAPVVQSVHWCFGAAGGAPVVVQSHPMATGRPITLEGSADRGWLDASADGSDADRSRRAQLQAWLLVPGLELTLTGLRDLADQTVIFRHEDGAALVLEPIDADSDHRRARYWRIALRLRVVG